MFQKYYWVVIIVVATAILYPLQKFIDAKWDLKKENLSDELVQSKVPFHINAPDTTFLLPTALNEISGLSLCPDIRLLGAVQDEEGKMFFINKENGKVLDPWKFGKGSDYEGIEVIDSIVYVVNSKGNITSIKMGDAIENSKVFKTFLKSDDNIEGLTGSLDKKYLILACKSSRDKKYKNRKLFSFDLQSNTLDSIPFTILDNQQIATALGREKVTPYFSPSAIATHPQTGEIFVISSPAKALIVLNAQGNLLSASKLDPSVHKQPEGMVIDKEGNLFISNEARNGVAKIHMFSPVNLKH